MCIEKIIETVGRKTPPERARMRVNAERLRDSGNEDQSADARKLLAALDDHDEAERLACYAQLKDRPLAERVEAAFTAWPATQDEADVIRALLDHPGAGSEALGLACGLAGEAWHLRLAALCKLREIWLSPSPRPVGCDAGYHMGLIAEFDDEAATFTMIPEAAQALAAVGIVATAQALAALLEGQEAVAA